MSLGFYFALLLNCTADYFRNGPSEFDLTGSIKDWSAIGVAKDIAVPTLLINGTHEGADDEAVAPFVEGIPGVKWVKFEKAMHMPQWEDRDHYMQVVKDFLSG